MAPLHAQPRVPKTLARLSAWALALLPLAFIADFVTFAVRSKAEVMLPKWQHADWARTADPGTWPDPKDLGMPLHYESVQWTFLAVLIGIGLVLPIVSHFALDRQDPTRIRVWRVSTFTTTLMVVLMVVGWRYVIWYLD